LLLVPKEKLLGGCYKYYKLCGFLGLPRSSFCCMYDFDWYRPFAIVSKEVTWFRGLGLILLDRGWYPDPGVNWSTCRRGLPRRTMPSYWELIDCLSKFLGIELLTNGCWGWLWCVWNYSSCYIDDLALGDNKGLEALFYEWVI